LDPGCEICRQTPHRRCRTSFARKYLSGDPVKAKCGAPIEIQVIDQVTGETVPGSQLTNLQIEVCSTSPASLAFPRGSPKDILGTCLKQPQHLRCSAKRSCFESSVCVCCGFLG